jgi:O-antigen chain-terminating methyltransferase
MLTVKHPQVDPQTLLTRVREAIERTPRQQGRPAATPLRAAAAPTGAGGPSLGVVERALAQAEGKWQVGMQPPPMHKVTGPARRVALPAVRLVLRAAQLVTRDQRDFNEAALNALKGVREHLQVLPRVVREVMAEPLEALEGRAAERVEALAGTLTGRLDGALAALAALEARVAGEREAARAEAGQAQAALERRLDALGERLARMEARQAAHDARALQLLLELRSHAPGTPLTPPAGEAVTRAAQELESERYLRFEDAFRGSREEIRERSRPYLEHVRKAGAGGADRPVLDLGCGRGEWLEVLREAGMTARGVDSNPVAVERVRALGLQAEVGDVLGHLRALPEASVGFVSAMHVVEHLPQPVLEELLVQLLRVLKPGGAIFLETPNPENLIVGANTFWTDPTHLRPIRPSVLRFQAEEAGFARAEVLPLHPMDPKFPVGGEGGRTAEELNALLCGPQDYAVLAFKA